jgi:hypothetical protein
MRPNTALVVGAVLVALLVAIAPLILMVTAAAAALAYTPHHVGRRNEAFLWATVIADLPPELQASVVDAYRLLDRGGE